MEPLTYRAKPVEVQAVQWTGNFADLPRNWRTRNQLHMQGGRLVVETIHGPVSPDVGDWIVLGVGGEFYPMPRAIFAYRYGLASDFIVTDSIVTDEMVERVLAAYNDELDTGETAATFFSMRNALRSALEEVQP